MASEMIACNLCGSEQTTPWLENRERGWGQFMIVRCDKCGLTFVNPRPTEESIAAYYPDEYYVYEETELVGTSRVKRVLSEIIARDFRGYVKTELVQDSIALPSRLLGYLLLYPFRNSLLRLPPYLKQGAKILDVGCATGKDLDLAKSYGWETYGVDISAKAAVVARRKGHQVSLGRLKDADFPPNFFNAVMLWDVMEHVHNPMELLCEINRILLPGGYLLGKALNVASVQAQLFRDKWWPGMDVPRHLYFYTPATIRSYLEKSGFRLLMLPFLSSPRCLSECLDLTWCDWFGKPAWQIPSALKLIDDVLSAPWSFLFDAWRVGDVMIFHAVKQREPN